MNTRLVIVITFAFILACSSASAKVYTLNSVQEADILCYYFLKDSSGKVHQIRGKFDICPQGDNYPKAMIGKKVSVTMGRGEVPDCGGDFGCGKTVEVDFVTGIKLAN